MQYRKTEHDPFFLATVTVTMAKRAFRKQNSAHAVNQLAIIFTIEKRRKQSLLELIRETLIRIWKWFHQLPLPIPTEAANVDSHALMLPQHHRPALRPPHPTTTIRRMKTWTIAPAVMDSMPPRGGERIIKIAQGVGCFKKKIIGRYPPSFPGQRRCRSRVVNPPVLLQTNELAPPPLSTISDHPHSNNIIPIPPIKRFRSYNKLFSSKLQKSTTSNPRTDPSRRTTKRSNMKIESWSEPWPSNRKGSIR